MYELSPTPSGWTEKTLYAFNVFSGGGEGDGSLIWDAHGNLFGISGTSFFEGETPSGVYELTPQNGGWSFTQLQTFASEPAGPVAAPTFDSQGNLYGPLPSAGNGSGLIFKLTPTGNQWVYMPFYKFNSCHDDNGCYPVGTVIFDANGNMYGTNTAGAGGKVWEITP